jgi:hypothetical protein
VYFTRFLVGIGVSGYGVYLGVAMKDSGVGT